jgi:hypothetical protein
MSKLFEIKQQILLAQLNLMLNQYRLALEEGDYGVLNQTIYEERTRRLGRMVNHYSGEHFSMERYLELHKYNINPKTYVLKSLDRIALV